MLLLNSPALLVTWICVFFPMMTTLSVGSIEIPCINNTGIATNSSITPFPLVSNQSYTLTNCVSDVVFIDLMLGSSSSTVFENVTVRVAGGNVLPRLSTAIASSATTSSSVPSTVRNIHVVVEQAHAVGEMIVSGGLPLTMVDISSGTATLQDITVTFVDSSLRLDVATANGAAVVVAPMLFLRPGAGAASVILSGVTISVVNSLLSVNANIIGNSSSLNNMVAMASFSMTQTGVMELIEVLAVNSTFVLMMVSAQPPSPLIYQECETAVISIRSDANKYTSSVTLRRASLIADLNTNLTIRCRVPRASSDIVAAVKIGSSMQAVHGVTILIKDSFAVIQNICRSNCSADDASFPRARVVCFAGNTRESNLMLSNITIVASHSMMILDSPKSALAVTVQNNAALHGLFINVLNCSAEVSSGNLNVGLSSRTQAIVDVSSSSNATQVYVLVRQVNATFFAESGDCMIALSAVVGALDNISYSRIEVVDVVVTSRTMNGTIFTIGTIFNLSDVLAPITMGTSLVNIAMQSTASLSVGVGLSISIKNATLDVLHATTVPTGPLFLLVVSIASIVNVVRLLTNSRIHVANSHIARSFPSTYLSLAGVIPSPGAHFNITAIVNLFDATSAILTINPQLATFASVMYEISGGLPPTIVHTNVSTQIIKNCTVSYSNAPQQTDCIALVMPPGVSNKCTYTIEDTQPLPSTRSVGSIIGVIGQSRLVNSSVTARRIRGLCMLMFACFKPTSFEGPLTALTFTGVSLYYGNYGIPMHQHPIGTQDTSFALDLRERSEVSSGRRVPACLTITHSVFKGFTALLMPDSINITSASPPSRVSPTLLALGCNVWDDVGLPHTLITSNTTVLNYVQYPWGMYNESIACHGLPGTSTVSVSTTLALHKPAPPPPAVPPGAVSTVTSVAGVIGAAAAAMIDAQSLVALGRSVCAPQAMHEATSASQFLLSPFYSLGDYAMVFGNLGLFLLFHGMHRFQLYRRKKLLERTSLASVTLLPELPSVVDGVVGGNPTAASPLATTIMRPAVSLKFPNHSISMAMLLAPGVVNGGMRGIFSGEVVDTIGGVVALIAVSLGVWWRWRSGNLREVKLMRFVPWPHQGCVAPCVWAVSGSPRRPSQLVYSHRRSQASPYPRRGALACGLYCAASN
ncbi:membrane-associated protein, putative [Bodo saltans]|uniref:Membrane-associated protein, putative n=1 Tax=Bodo saltans TaxID=75058 RepID=A0A0S4J4F7_BODSA|nr:membrane-associated protein, putative [Bodo saltans]|eukprot:CUG86353.1 membrane-associated protein, putative [Bodo saltans]